MGSKLRHAHDLFAAFAAQAQRFMIMSGVSFVLYFKQFSQVEMKINGVAQKTYNKTGVLDDGNTYTYCVPGFGNLIYPQSL